VTPRVEIDRTASGGAWNASVIAEYFHLKGQIYSTVGLSATISRATDSGNFNLLIASTIVTAAIVVAINRLVWRRLYVWQRRDLKSA
jgi:NitT/TauT family transport system permease protein